jgi:hypothetical protein
MKFINLTPHAINVYSQGSFKNLERVDATTLVADRVDGEAILDIPSSGNLRISTKTEILKNEPFVMASTAYGALVGLPEDLDDESILIVSLPCKSNAILSGNPLSKRMVSPFEVVRLKSNTSQVIGCIGFTY